MTAQEVLAAAASLIEKHGHCQSHDALDHTGKPVLPHSRGAVARSMTGALLAAGRRTSGRAWLDALHALAVAVGAADFKREPVKVDDIPAVARTWCEKMWQWEDTPGRTHAHVLAAFDRAKEYIS